MKDVVVIPKATVARLPLYFRVLNEYYHLNITMLSSEEIARKLDITSSQLRRDLSYFGDLGIRGAGYDVSFLLEKIKIILGMDKKRQLAVIGAGKIGTALAGYSGFKQHGLEVAALFEVNETKLKDAKGPIPMYHISHLAKEKERLKMEIAVLTVPATVAQEVADRVVEVGFKAIWNFVPLRLDVPEDVIVQYEDLVIGALTLSHHLSRQEG